MIPLERSDFMECLENNANENHHEAFLTASDGYTNNDTSFYFGVNGICCLLTNTNLESQLTDTVIHLSSTWPFKFQYMTCPSDIYNVLINTMLSTQSLTFTLLSLRLRLSSLTPVHYCIMLCYHAVYDRLLYLGTTHKGLTPTTYDTLN